MRRGNGKERGRSRARLGMQVDLGCRPARRLGLATEIAHVPAPVDKSRRRPSFIWRININQRWSIFLMNRAAVRASRSREFGVWRGSIASRGSRTLVLALIALFIASGLIGLNAAPMAGAAPNGPCPTPPDATVGCTMRLAASNTPGVPQAPSRPAGAWRLMRAPNPHGGPDAVSIVHTVDIARSDVDLAGLMLRCAPGGIEALIIVLDPRPPSSRPWVKARAAGMEEQFEARIVPPFTALLLPPEAAALLTGQWRTSDEVAIEIEAEPSAVKGTVSLAGLGPALDDLRASCPPQ